MSKNPLFNALGASAYIAVVVTIMNFVSKTLGNKPDTFFAPAIFLSILTLSVAVMGYMFFYQPVQLFISGNKKAAAGLFVRSVVYFAVLTAISLTLLLVGVI